MEFKEKEIEKIELVISIPHLAKEFNVSLPISTLGIQLKNALEKKVPSLNMKLKSGEEFNFDFYCKGIRKMLELEKSMQENGIANGETIIVKKDLDAG